MLKLFQSIFGGNENHGRYPESMIEMAIDRVMEGTDSRLRAVSGSRKRLREPVIHAIDHVVALVGLLSAPLAADITAYGRDPRIKALFSSTEHMREVYGNDRVLNGFRDAQGEGADTVTALLLAEPEEKHVFGVELSGETLRRDVAQVTFNFHHHRLVDAASGEEETRRLLRRRAFDHLISLALSRISEAKDDRADLGRDLGRQRDLLRAKLRALRKGGWSFDYETDGQSDPAALQTELDEIEGQLAGLKGDDSSMSGQLDMIGELFANAEKHFWAQALDLHLDCMNIVRAADDAAARLVSFQELRNARGQRMATLLVSLRPGELPGRENFSAKADRLLI